MLTMRNCDPKRSCNSNQDVISLSSKVDVTLIEHASNVANTPFPTS